MPQLHLVLDYEQTSFDALSALGVREGGHMEGRLRDLIDEGTVIHMGEGSTIEVGGLPAGMESGAPSVMFAFALPDERVVLAETSLALLLTAADAFKGRYGDPRR